MNRVLIITVLISLFAGSCSFTKKVKDGETAYAYRQYFQAIELLGKELEQGNEDRSGRKSYMLSKSYLMTSDIDNALIWMKRALDKGYNPLAWKELGTLYKMAEDYPQAIVAFEEYGKKTGNTSEADREIRICRQVMEWNNQPSEYTVDKIFENSFSADYSPAIYEKDFLIFTSDRQMAGSSEKYLWTGEKFSDLFIMLKNGSDVRKFDLEINSGHNEGTPCFSRDYSTLYFTRCYSFGTGDARCKIMQSRRIDGFFTEPEPLNFIQDRFNYGHPALFENDSILIFSADINDPGVSYDLFYSELDENGLWSEPEPLPNSINTIGNEKFPTTHGDTLYFSSDYLSGLGGLDIFKTYLKKDRSWANPENLRRPINSGGDDFGLIVDDYARLTGNMKQKGYFSSVRKGTGKEDIFIFTRRPLPVKTDTTLIAGNTPQSIKKSVFLAGKTLESYYQVEDDPSSILLGTRQLPSVNIRIREKNGKTIFQGTSGLNGIFAAEIEENNHYIIIANKNGYLNRETEISSYGIDWKTDQNSHTINSDIVLQKLFKNKEITLQNIYYDYDKWDITPTAAPILDELADLLRVNPQIRIQLSSHTDCRGERAYNQILSQKRAQSAVDYLIYKGIDYERLTAKGYGEDKLLINCECNKCTEEEHQLNRRTTFTILD